MHWSTGIGVRFFALVALAVVSLTGLAAYKTWQAAEDDWANRRAFLEGQVHSVLSGLSFYDGEVKAGRMPLEEAQRLAADTVRAIRYEGSEYFWINDMGPTMVMHPIKPELQGQDLTNNRDPNGKALFVEMVKTARAGGGFVDYIWPRPGSDAPVPKLSYVEAFQPWGWIVGTGVYVDDMTANTWAKIRDTGIAILVVAAGFAAVAVVLIRGVTGPLGDLRNAMERLSHGDLVQVPGLERRDEIGTMARTVAVFRDTIERRSELEAQQNRSSSDLRQRSDEMKRTVDAFRAEAAALFDEMQAEMNSFAKLADGVDSTSGETDRITGQTATAVDQAARSVSGVASSAQQLTSSISEIAAQVDRSTALIGSATENVRSSNQQVEQLARAAERIGEVVELIQTIAAQTNLLALNATIEAARAGEAGKGFAVVATEVKSLAAQTAKATEEIASQVGAIQSSTNSTVEGIRAIAATMETVNSYTAAIAAAVEEQGAATDEISRNIAAASDGTSGVRTNMASVTAQVGETRRAAAEMRRAAATVASRAENLKARVGDFMSNVARG